MINRFFAEWGDVERNHPWGVQRFTPLFSRFNVPLRLCVEIDDMIFLDLMNPNNNNNNIHRIKVEGRYSGAEFWVYVEELPHLYYYYPSAMIMMIVSIQRHPNAPMERSLLVEAVPRSLVACILAFYRWMMIKGKENIGAVVCRRWKNSGYYSTTTTTPRRL